MTDPRTRFAAIEPTRSPVIAVTGGLHFDVVGRFPRLPRDNDRLPVTEMTLAPGGMGGNVAAAFARLGGRARFAGPVSQDADGQALRTDLARDGVDVRWTLSRPVTYPYRGFILVGERGERAILGLWPVANQLEPSPGQAPGVVHAASPELGVRRRRVAGGAVLHPDALTAPLSACYCPVSHAPVVLPALPPGLPLFMDLETGHINGWDTDEVHRTLGRATILYGNAGNLRALADRLGAPLERLGLLLDTVIIETTGRDGCVIHHAGVATRVPGYDVAAVDTTGAGDCFAAAFTLAVLRGEGLPAAARFANAAAALSTRRLGSRPGVPDAAELAAFQRERDAMTARRTRVPAMAASAAAPAFGPGGNDGLGCG